MTDRMHKPSRRRAGPIGVRTWLSIRVELVEGRGERYWPRPGRLFAAARSHSFGQLASAIDDAFARWDRSHLHEFELADGTRIGMNDLESGDEDLLDEIREKLSRLQTSGNLSMCSTLVTTGHTCAPSSRPASIRATPSARFLMPPCRTSVGETSRISTGVLGLTRKRKLPHRQIPS
jgi:hypothetical protein